MEQPLFTVLGVEVNGSNLLLFVFLLTVSIWIVKTLRERAELTVAMLKLLRPIVDINIEVQKRIIQLIIQLLYVGIFSNVVNVVKIIVAQNKSKINKRKLENITIVGLLVGQKAKQSSIGYVFLFLTLIVYSLLSFFLDYELKGEIVVILVLFITIIFINQKVLDYRIKKGLYGTNEYEAREILTFLLNQADKSNFSDGSGLRSIMPTPEPDNVYGIELIEGVRGAEA